MYKSHFNLHANPFSIAPDPRFLYMSEQHREALAHLMFALKTEGGFVLLTGEVGTGKTTVCRCLLEQLPDDLNVAFVLNPKLTAGELLATICDELRIDYPAGTSSMKILVDRINRYLLEAHAAGRRTVLIIDEAQNLSAEVLEQIRLLTNLETTQRKLLQVVMLGQPELRELLSRPELRQLSQRITARYHLGPLARDEVAAYINHRLAVAGYRRKLFSDRVVGLVYRYTGGIPRLINILCDRALLGAYVQGVEKVTAATLKTAAREVLAPETTAPPDSAFRSRLVPALLVAALLGVGLASGWQYWGNRILSQSAPSPADPPRTATPVATAEAESPAPIWPATIDSAASAESSYARLLALWNIEYQTGTPACQQAEEAGLACLFRKSNLGSLLRLNRPAVLNMLTSRGDEFNLVLTSIDQGLATLSLEGREVRIPTAELESHWTGSYTIFWRPPAGFSGAIRPHRPGPARDWLTARLADLNGVKPAGSALSGAVKKFQQSEGLLADGIAGPETIIHLNSRTGQPVVLLTRN